MEIGSRYSLRRANPFPLPKPGSCSAYLPPTKASFHSIVSFQAAYDYVHITRRKLQYCSSSSQLSNFGPVKASVSQSNPTADGERWILQPVGDGDSRHIGFKVPMPNAFEIASSVVTIGRLPEKADLVIPVATVSALHARIQNKGGGLLVTDLDSTNGTFIDERRLTPGAATLAAPGSYITFGDTNLAIFKVSKVENVTDSGKSEDSEAKLNTEDPSSSSGETTS